MPPGVIAPLDYQLAAKLVAKFFAKSHQLAAKLVVRFFAKSPKNLKKNR